jgi:hypothetical protein
MLTVLGFTLLATAPATTRPSYQNHCPMTQTHYSPFMRESTWPRRACNLS